MTNQERYAKIRELLTADELTALKSVIDAADELADELETDGSEDEADTLNAHVALVIEVIGVNPMLEAATQG